MEEKDIMLYKVQTVGCGEFYTIATSFDDAASCVTITLDECDYGYSSDREVKSIELVRIRHFYNGKQFFSGGDINRFILDNDLLK